MRLYTCCPNAGCTSYREALTFLNSFGVEPSINVDEIGNHYFEFKLPEERREEFLEALCDVVEIRGEKD